MVQGSVIPSAQNPWEECEGCDCEGFATLGTADGAKSWFPGAEANFTNVPSSSSVYGVP